MNRNHGIITIRNTIESNRTIIIAGIPQFYLKRQMLGCRKFLDMLDYKSVFRQYQDIDGHPELLADFKYTTRHRT